MITFKTAPRFEIHDEELPWGVAGVDPPAEAELAAPEPAASADETHPPDTPPPHSVRARRKPRRQPVQFEIHDEDLPWENDAPSYGLPLPPPASTTPARHEDVDVLAWADHHGPSDPGEALIARRPLPGARTILAVVMLGASLLVVVPRIAGAGESDAPGRASVRHTAAPPAATADARQEARERERAQEERAQKRRQAARDRRRAAERRRRAAAARDRRRAAARQRRRRAATARPAAVASTAPPPATTPAPTAAPSTPATPAPAPAPPSDEFGLEP